MRYIVEQEQIDHFKKSGTLTLEMPLTDAERSALDPKLPLFNPWTESEDLRRLVFSRKRAEIVAKLFETPMLRLGYALLTANLQKFTLEKSCCLQGAIATLTIDLETPDHIVIRNKFVPHKIDTPTLVIAYCTENIIFKNNKDDPFFSYIKAEGQAYGDHLQTEKHPFLCRK